MRLAALPAIALLALAACERGSEDAPAPPETTRAAIPVSDELPGLSAAATGVAFWEHPTLAFNSMLIVAGADGAAAYNIEDGIEAARLDDIAADGAALSYFGYGANAAGVLALFEAAENRFSFYGVDNATRRFLPLAGGPAIDGPLRGFCLGRGRETPAPALFALQDGRVRIFNLDATQDGVTVSGEGAIDAPVALVSCAVDIDGVLVAAAEDGAVYRVDGAESFAAPFARMDVEKAGDIAIVAVEPAADGPTIRGQIALLDEADGALHLADRTDGSALGVVTVEATDQLPGVTAARAMGLSGANFGALYRNGVAAFAVTAEDGPALRLAPYGAVLNALSLPAGRALSPRGEATAAPENALIIDAPPAPRR